MSTVYTPLPTPTTSDAAKIPAPTPEQQKLYDAVLTHFSADAYTIPGEENGKLTEAEKFWLSYECLNRYLRAVKWKSADAAIQRLEATLKWRRSFGVYDKITAEFVEPEALTGKEVIFGNDVQGRPAVYLIPSRQNTQENPKQIDFVVYMLESAIDLMGPGVESLALLINFGDRGKNPSMGTSRSVLNILQEHYPERLGSALIINIPFLVNAFFKLILPFVDPITRQKVHFNPDTVKDGLFTSDNIMKEHWGGAVDFKYEHEKYWPALVEMTTKQRAAWMAKWEELGAKVGVKEWDYKASAPQATVPSTEVAESAPASS
ncbi:CRAL/TRIO domain-containing protein [Cylindrobasidium torrendii FP15055 ss-10]|uniref:CRAL/TRIO domain-containing protein n=1 Tax=Cylindrobasidium torrendii FP15055 ss-10 TaxID=1314674 RepID=A0A0D7BPE5_9AGAR|nr:CRAL/TRIO domain-containing protein [Cylindrobasidium torrendii FP15055 ss-10]